ncbi:putative mitochondrial carrier protein [Aulographum hederae CBS 113979]|uniref:Putative mitochondrial carrier protein n=1 Tax=Aulographum hederae CBS 113979 TaxID=1176131 RepID=A0A6G1GSU0_9PEZI|nr:putative mitochondrial carrier protein [Aulographum hederae CBS 113979]
MTSSAPTRSPFPGTVEDGTRKKQNAATGASAASIRAVSAQFVAFYFRAPMKAFFRTRIDYMAYARAIDPRVQSAKSWSWRTTTAGVLAHAVKEHGWSFIPNQILPPMLANVTVGAVLYTSYLQSLGVLYEPSSRSSKRVYPPPSLAHTFTAGFAAGTVQSVVAAPLDALQVRFETNDMLEGKYRNMWHYARDKLREIGPRGVFAGWSLSFVKDAFGYGAFFATFEYLKAQSYYSFVTRYYGKYEPIFSFHPYRGTIREENGRLTIRPHYALEPTFILIAGIAASIVQQVVQHPLSKVQGFHYNRLESLDYAAKLQGSRSHMMRLYYHAYQKTFEQCERQASRHGGWRRWLYRGFFMNTIRQVPSTSAGLIVFEVVRRKYARDSDVVRIEKDGYDVLLS